MKKILLYICAAALCLLTSCEKELTMAEKLVGDWHCTAASTDAEIYVTFRAENTFTLYQQIGEGAYRLYRGTWNLEGDLLTGKYNDGEDWAAAYKNSDKVWLYVDVTGLDALQNDMIGKNLCL